MVSFTNEMTTSASPSQDERNRQAVLDALAKLGNVVIGEDSLRWEGSSFVFPASMREDYDGVIRFIKDYDRQQNSEFSFRRTFKYRWQDGAAAFERAMKKVFGTSGVGGTIHTFFGKIPPEYRTVNVGPSQTIQVPWNKIVFSPLDASFYLTTTRSQEYGEVFEIVAEMPRKYRAHIEAFFQIIENELQINSIYRGKAFTGGAEPIFLDTAAVDPERVIYSEEVLIQLETSMWSLIRHTESMRNNRIPLKRAVLVEGPYGTGKTLTGLLTAKIAVEHGWTFIKARPGKDSLEDILKTAQLYAPAVVWFEDIDVPAKGKDDEQISVLLDILDGITAKGTEVLAGFTTNEVHKLQKGVLRPGRIDAVIHIGGLDEEGYEKLVKVLISPEYLGNIDYKRVAEALDGMLPAFAKEAIDRAMRYSISRNNGVPGLIETEDLVHAANGLRPQLELMNDAVAGATIDPLEKKFAAVISDALHGSKLLDETNDPIGTLYTQGKYVVNGSLS